MFFILLVGAILVSGLAYADQPQQSGVKGAEMARTLVDDANWNVRSGELHQFNAERPNWSSKAAKQAQYDTLLHFTGEGPSWADEVQMAEWDTVDLTAVSDTLWHRDTFKAISGTYSMWWGDPVLVGYTNERYERMKTPAIIVEAGDAPFLIYKHLIRCEEAHGFGIFEGWDGYNVRVDDYNDPQGFTEMPPYKVALDSSYYHHPPSVRHEWNILRCWERHGQQIGPYLAPYDQWIGGFAFDSTAGNLYIETKIMDLRPFAGDTIQIAFDAASDWGYDTTDDSTLFGFILDDILIVDGLDSLTLATLPDPLGGDTLFFEDFEDALVGWDIGAPGVPTGNWWWLAAGGHSGIYKAYCSDPFSGAYPENCNNVIRSPKIAKTQISSDMADMRLHWYLKCRTADDHSNASNEYKLDDGQWRAISVLTHPLGTSYVYSLAGVDDNAWWNTDQWSNFMTDMTPLVQDTTIVYDTLQVQIGFSSDAGFDTTGYIGLQVDDVTLAGRIGAPYDVGVSAMKLPNPNANDLEVVVDSVTITNYGFNTAASGTYQVYMCVLDTFGVAAMDTTQVLAFGDAPNIDPLEQAMVNLNADAKWTLTEEQYPMTVKVWTAWALDTTAWNDTLKVYEHSTDTKQAWVYPDFYNYPAGQGALRYNDGGLYYYPYINIRTMSDNDIAAVHFTPDPDFYPFWIRLGLFQMADSNHTCTFHVWGSGNTPAEAPLLTSVTINSDSSRVVLSDSSALEHLSSDFWMGIEFPTGRGSVMGVETGENDPDEFVGRNWGHSYLYTDTAGWVQYDFDWLIDAVISWRTVHAEAMPSLSGPPAKNSSGNLWLNWPDVSQAKDYLIYRSTHVESLFPFLDSTALGTSDYTDVGVVGSTTTHHYYLFNTRHQGGFIYDKTSGAIGEFDIDLQNAK
jgi:hypothetical protein